MEAVKLAKSLQVLKVMAEVRCDQVSQILNQRPSLIEVQLRHVSPFRRTSYFVPPGFVEMPH